MRTLYFDIDGVLLSYEEEQRPLLSGGVLEEVLKRKGFGKLVCVSAWADLYNERTLGNPEPRQRLLIHTMLDEIFTDKKWFLDVLELGYDSDHRCKHINLKEDWYYMDDWADKFFKETFGETAFRQHLGRRILQVNPHGDGSDILRWLEA